jgi:hypothetical protein
MVAHVSIGKFVYFKHAMLKICGLPFLFLPDRSIMRNPIVAAAIIPVHATQA